MLSEKDVFESEIKDFEIELLAPDIVLATYKIKLKNNNKQWDKYSLRSSIWKFDNEKGK